MSSKHRWLTDLVMTRKAEGGWKFWMFRGGRRGEAQGPRARIPNNNIFFWRLQAHQLVSESLSRNAAIIFVPRLPSGSCQSAACSSSVI